jgi:predicted transcriptional regulator
MNAAIPSAEQVRAALKRVPTADLADLAASSGVPLPTLVKVRNGQTSNPRIETVRAVWPALCAMSICGAAAP